MKTVNLHVMRLLWALFRGVFAALALFGVPGLLADGGEFPNNMGILRLVRGWERHDVPDGKADAAAAGLFAKTPKAGIGAVLDLEKLPPPDKHTQVDCDRIIFKAFAVPSAWRGREVYLTYDARRLVESGVCRVWLNGGPLQVGLPVDDGRDVRPTLDLDQAANQGKPAAPATWFVEVGSRLVLDKPNMLAFRVRRWPMYRSAGFWLYCPPASERVLFLQSARLSTRATRLVRGYADNVAKRFAVQPLIETLSFGTADELRQYLRGYHARHGISGAVLIGDHPILSYRFGAGGETGGQPRYYEDLDAVFTDSDNDSQLDTAVAPANFGTEIWTAWIRLVPGQQDRFERYLQKLEDYYEGRLIFPGDGKVFPDDFPQGTASAGDCGLKHFDAFMQPSDHIFVGAHGGTGHMVGPHLAIAPEEAVELYPGALVVELAGCHAGDIRRDRLTAAEAYLYGRSNGLLVLTNAKSEGAANPRRHAGWRRELLAICPHFGPFYQYLVDLRGQHKGPFGDYLSTGFILLGNPFINLGHRLAAPGATIAGKLTPTTPADPVEGFYVSATRGGKWFGRVSSDAQGNYALRCLPSGTYEVRLHLNALEYAAQTVTVAAGGRSRCDFRLPRLWCVTGQVMDQNEKPAANGWAEIAAEPDDEEFLANDLFGLRTDQDGRFAIYGSRDLTFHLRGRLGRQFESEPVKVVAEPARKIKTPPLHVEGDIPEVKCTIEELLDFQPQVRLGVPDARVTHPLADIREVRALLVPNGNRTLRGKGQVPRHVDRGETRGEHTLRLAFRVAQQFPNLPDRRVIYRWAILPDTSRPLAGSALKVSTLEVRILYSVTAGRYTAKLKDRQKNQSPGFWLSPPFVVGDWMVVDLNPFTNDDIEWYVGLMGAMRGVGPGAVKETPKRGGWRLKASVGQSPKVSLTVVDPGATRTP